MAELLFEIGCEEMPARFIKPALEQLHRLAQEQLSQHGLFVKDSEAKTLGTPRRLALQVFNLDQRQPDKEEVFLGPPVKAAYDQEGNPTKAALGFAKSQGVEVSDLEAMDTEKGERVGVKKTIPGRPALEVLSELLPRLVSSLTFPKTMRWGAEKFLFARPIHWFLALWEGQVIPFELADIKSGDLTYGHRFMSPEPIALKSAAEYVEKLGQAHVIVDREERRRLTQMEVETTAQKGGGRLVPDDELMEEVTDLVELPVACCGAFDQEFLKVPRPVIISAMRGHQRYFALEDDQGRLLPKFIAVNNTRPKSLAVVTRGHEKVLRARLADARFFLDEDGKRTLADCLEELKEVTYHAKLGTSFEKVERFTKLALYLADRLGLDEKQKGQVERAARLCKCDLVTEMVGEFPDLQGVVGREYALRDKEDPEVAEAIAEHYMPASAEAGLATGMAGAIVGLADRLDTICGMFGIGQSPTGAADPYGLRRAAIAVIRTVTEKELPLSLEVLLDEALQGLKTKLENPAPEIKQEVIKFFAARFQGLLTELGVPTDVAQAVLAAGLDDLAAVKGRALALAQVKETPEFKPLAIGMKRVMNILRKEAQQVPDSEPDPALMTEPQEKALYESFGALQAQAQDRFARGDYLGFLQGVSALKGPIDEFFDHVLVMEKDEALRNNRLALLQHIAALFAQLAQFTHLQLV
ncbi:MAG: glycine--tRNA ligase subunit beta [Desulfarculaceae bacterium]|jgi:glycyl-tRNA synthetase beta chain